MPALFLDGADHLKWPPWGKWQLLPSYLSFGVTDGNTEAGINYETATPAQLRSGEKYADYCLEFHNSYFGSMVFAAPVVFTGGVVGFHFQSHNAVITEQSVPTGSFLVFLKESGGTYTQVRALGTRQSPSDPTKGRFELSTTWNGAPTGSGVITTDYEEVEVEVWKHLEVRVGASNIQVYADGGALPILSSSTMPAFDRVALVRSGLFYPGWRVDNFYVLDEDPGLGIPLGACRVSTIWANEDRSAEFDLYPSSSTGKIWNRVWEHAGVKWNDPNPPTHTDFWSDSQSGYPDTGTYAYSSSPAGFWLRFPNFRFLGGTLLGVQLNVTAAVFPGTGSPQIVGRVRKGDEGEILESDPQTVVGPLTVNGGTYWKTHRFLFPVSPVGPWTEADFIGGVSAQFGARFVSGSGQVRISQVCVERLHCGAGGGAGSEYEAF